MTPINLELDKKIIHTSARLFSGPLSYLITQSRSTQVNRTSSPLETLEKYYSKLVGSKIEELKKKPAYIMPPWWCPQTINIPNTKKKAAKLYDEFLASKTPMEIVTDGSGINEKIGSSCVIPEKFKTIKSFLGARTHCTVYMEELQGIQDFLSYAIQGSDIQIFTDNQAVLQALDNPYKCSAPQIMQAITQHIDDLRARGMPIHLQ